MSRKAYRDAFVGSQISGAVASQIVTLRSKRKWTQTDLAKRAGMRQSRISALEDPNYENIEVGTLRRIASAFDVGLIVRFAPFSEIAKEAVGANPAGAVILPFEDDAFFCPEETSTRPVENYQSKNHPPETAYGAFKPERPSLFCMN